MDSVQVLLITRITVDSKLGFWRDVLGCAKRHSECVQMCFPPGSQIPQEWVSMRMKRGGFSLCWLRPCLFQLLLFSLCILQHFLQGIGHPCLSLTKLILWISAPGSSGSWLNPGTRGDPFLCSRHLLSIAQRESCCCWSWGYPGPQAILYSGNQRPRISIILGVAVH